MSSAQQGEESERLDVHLDRRVWSCRAGWLGGGKCQGAPGRKKSFSRAVASDENERRKSTHRLHTKRTKDIRKWKLAHETD